mmetsp:Transcript_30322/g.39138  ORF Transcript_30322/g.39138 Transcript_30322/m.39138 type:complete len:96 (-) Transcript_30322:1098-1385(-)
MNFQGRDLLPALRPIFLSYETKTIIYIIMHEWFIISKYNSSNMNLDHYYKRLPISQEEQNKTKENKLKCFVGFLANKSIEIRLSFYVKIPANSNW